jgi:hypothetical protein
MDYLGVEGRLRLEGNPLTFGVNELQLMGFVGVEPPLR